MNNNFISTFLAELKNQRKNYFGRLSSIITLLIWPFLSFLTIYYTYQSFDISSLQSYGIHNNDDLIVFITSGMLVYNCFWAMVQGAGQIQYDRKSGTLEAIILSPASKLGFVYGRAFGGIIHNAWMFTFLCLIIFVKYVSFSIELVCLLVLIFLLLAISGTIFGGFITTLFLFSRDTNFIFTLCDYPMNFLSGTSLPLLCLPIYVRICSGLLPTSYLIDLFRKVAIENYTMTFPIIGLCIILSLLVICTNILMKRILEKARENDTYILF